MQESYFPQQGSNWCSLHWKHESYPLDHQESPQIFLIVLHTCTDLPQVSLVNRLRIGSRVTLHLKKAGTTLSLIRLSWLVPFSLPIGFEKVMVTTRANQIRRKGFFWETWGETWECLLFLNFKTKSGRGRRGLHIFLCEDVGVRAAATLF